MGNRRKVFVLLPAVAVLAASQGMATAGAALSPPAAAGTAYPVEAVFDAAGATACGVATDPAYRRAYVTTPTEALLVTFDTSPPRAADSRAVGRNALDIPGTFPDYSCDVAVDYGNHNVYVKNRQSRTVAALTGTAAPTHPTVVAHFASAELPTGVAVDSVTHLVYVTHAENGTVAVYDGRNGPAFGTLLRTLQPGPLSGGIAVDPSAHRVYLGGPDDMIVVDGRPGALFGAALARVPIGAAAAKLAVDRSTRRVYVTTAANALVVIDDAASRPRVVQKLGVPATPWGVAVDEATHTVYVASAAAHAVTVVDDAAPAGRARVVATTEVWRPHDVAVDQLTHRVYVADEVLAMSVIAPQPDRPTVDLVATASGVTTATASLTRPSIGDLIVAFVAADGPIGGDQTATFTGSSLVAPATLAGRENRALGDSEIWSGRLDQALFEGYGPEPFPFTATASKPGYRITLTVVAFRNAGGLGAVTTAYASRVAPTGAVVTTGADALVFGVGNDWLHAIPRAVAAGPRLLFQRVDRETGDTYWVQSAGGTIRRPGTRATVRDTAPTTDPYNLVVAEVR